MGKALASGRRAEVIDVLAQGVRSVDELAGEITQSLANTSHHLGVLARAGLVERRRKGTRIYYRLAEGVWDLWAALRGVAEERVDGVERLAEDYLGDRSRHPTMAHDELVQRLADTRLEVWDMRPTAEFAAGHIAGARSVPVREVSSELARLDPAHEVVAYCRGPYCAYADEAVSVLRAAGRRASRLEHGFPEWRRAGRPVAEGFATVA